MTNTSNVLDEEYKSPSTVNASTPWAWARRAQLAIDGLITPRFGLLFTPVWAALSSSTKRVVLRASFGWKSLICKCLPR